MATKKTSGGRAAGPIDAYLAAIGNAAARATLTRLRAQLRQLLPTATETISYGIPAFRLPNGKVVAGFAFFGKNCGYYPHSGNIVPQLGALLDGRKTSPGGISFAPDAPLPKNLVTALVRARLAEIADKTPAPKAARASAAKAPRPPKTVSAPKATPAAKTAQPSAKRAPSKRKTVRKTTRGR